MDVAPIDLPNQQCISTQNKTEIDNAEENRSSKRYFLPICIFIVSSFKANVSIAMIEMTKNRTMEVDNSIIQYEPEFQWDSKMQGLVLSMFGYGTLLSLIGGIVVRKFGGVTTWGYALLSMGMITTLNPFIVRFSYNLFLLSRFLDGVFENFCYVSTSEILSRWSSKEERSKMASFATTANLVGSTVALPLCGLLARYWEWPSIFYVGGAVYVAISLIVIMSFTNDPIDDKYISKKELEHLIRKSENSQNEKITYFWKEMLTKKCLWALVAAHIAYACGNSFMDTCLPIYVEDMTGMKIDQIGVLSGIPRIANIFTVTIAGYLADYLQNSKILTPTQVHKTYMLVGFGFGAMCLFAVSSISNFTINLILLVGLKILVTIDKLTITLAILHMAPRHSSSLTAIISYGYSIGVSFTPMLMGFVVTSHATSEWSIFLSSIGGIILAAGAIFVLFGSSEIQDVFP